MLAKEETVTLYFFYLPTYQQLIKKENTSPKTNQEAVLSKTPWTCVYVLSQTGIYCDEETP